jgi:chromosome segregation ATPase
MEFDQIIKRLDWLDDQQRKDKMTLEALTEKLSNTEGELNVANEKIRDLNNELSMFSNILSRIDQFNQALSQMRADIIKYVDKMDNKDVGKLPEAETRFQLQIDNLSRSIAEQQKLKEPIAEIKRALKISADEEARHNRQISGWEPRFQEIVRAVEQVQLAQKATEGPRLQDRKRLADLQGAIEAARKRMDEVREKNDLFPDSIRRIETRLNEIIAGEAERRQTQTVFIENQARFQVERDRALKEEQEHLANMKKQTVTMDRQLQEWDGVQRAAKRAQETYEEIVQKFERRINEISEMQRLAEDRFRQEWVTLKADDQKRWTSYTLSQDEIHKEARSNVGKFEERLTVLEDSVQTQQDILQQTKDANEQLFQGILAQIHEFLSSYERVLSTK